LNLLPLSVYLSYPQHDQNMFGTFRYSKTTKDYEHVELSNDDNVDARGYTLLACDSCRARKVLLVLLQLIQFASGSHVLYLRGL
jgi:hypothetical protein